jgi:hypothetical protein
VLKIRPKNASGDVYTGRIRQDISLHNTLANPELAYLPAK